MTDYMKRLVLPYKDIFTTVYLIKTPKGAILFDTASYDEDIDNAIIPFLAENDVTAKTLKYVFISHNHRDHAGGLKRFMQIYPDTCIVSCSNALAENYEAYHVYMPKDGDLLLDTLQVVTIPGHTQDSAALLDTRTNTLITGDSLQLYGIVGSEDWACNITLPEEHFEALEKVRTLDVTNIIAAHDYYPYGYIAIGKEEVTRVLDACIAPLEHLQEIILKNPALDDSSVREIYNSTEHIPTIRETVVAAMRRYLIENKK